VTPRLCILQVTETNVGGTFTSVTRLSNELAARGHQVHLAVSRLRDPSMDMSSWVSPAVAVHDLRLVRQIDPAQDLAGFLAIRRLIDRLAPDVVHLHSSKAGVLGRLAAWSTGDSARMFYSPRGLSFLQQDASPRARSAFRTIEWACARLGGTVVACSESEASLVRRHIRPRRIALIDNAVDTACVPRHEERADGIVRVGIAGRITHARNPGMFGELARRHAGPRTRFVWVGGGDDDDALRLAQAGVEVTGWKPRAEALVEMSRLDVYLHPSLWEGMPIALIEAQTAGLPAVATDIIGNRDVIREGETGFLRADVTGLGEALDRLIGDHDLRQRMGASARVRALARFDIKRMVDEYEHLYATAPRRV